MTETNEIIDKGEISDGYHTFNEHRVLLYMALCKMLSDYTQLGIWMTDVHADGSVWDDRFLLGINSKEGTQITYHLPMKYWDTCVQFAEVLIRAPHFDGHTSDDVLKRLEYMITTL